jgi:hypothetical protein
LAILISTSLALSSFNRYGESWDENTDRAYARDVVASYRGEAPDWDHYRELKYYGPAYLMIWQWAGDNLARLNQAWTALDAGHFVNHATFLLAVPLLYSVCRRFVHSWASAVGALLFATQPLLFGHSFINEKDVPFMVAFLAAVAAGFWVRARSVSEGGPDPGRARAGPSLLAGDWRRASKSKKAVLSLTVLLAVMLTVDLLLLNAVVLPALQRTISRAYDGTSFELINRWFRNAAQDSAGTPAEAYVAKATRLFLDLRFLGVLAAWVPSLVAARFVFPSALLARNPARWLLGGRSGSYRSGVPVCLAGAALGIAVSIRPAGLLAGALVTLLLLSRGGRPPGPIVLYWAVGTLISYATWPYLWWHPIRNLIESVRTMAAFPWNHAVLYWGTIFRTQPMPWHYAVFFILTQLTVPAVLLAAWGILAGIRRALGRRLDRTALVVLMVWLGLPLAGAVILRATLYDNMRQFLFVLPPLFVIGSLGIERALQEVGRPALCVVVSLLLLVPGLAGILTLHPYEYVFYNSFVGGVGGAFRRFELDYWGTSTREAMEIVNAVAPPGAVIVVSVPPHLADAFARDDLILVSPGPTSPSEPSRPQFAVLNTRANLDLDFFPEQTAAWEVRRDGAVLAVIKDLRVGGSPAAFDPDGPYRLDGLLTATTPTTAFEIGAVYGDSALMQFADLLTVPADHAGVPGLSIPAGLDSRGLPHRRSAPRPGLLRGQAPSHRPSG